MARHSRPLRVGRAQRRETSWFDIPALQVTLDNASQLVASLTAAELAKRPFTIMRTHLEVLIHSDQVGVSATEHQFGAIGMCVVSDQALAIGITAVPVPGDDAASDLWFLHQWMFSAIDFATAIGFDSDAGAHYHIDSKAARKVNDDQDLVVVVQGLTLGEGVTFAVGGRILIKEH